MDELQRPHNIVVKEEPVDFSYCVNTFDCRSDLDLKFHDCVHHEPGRDFTSTVIIDEMDVKNVKAEEHLYSGQKNKELEENVRKPSKKRESRPVTKKSLSTEQALKLAKTYADLHVDNVPWTFPYQNFSGPTILFQCPRCMIPSKCASHSAFLKLLHHVSRNHPQETTRLFNDIMQRYKPFIGFMKRKIASRKKTACLRN